jgi:hypothetical protein
MNSLDGWGMCEKLVVCQPSVSPCTFAFPQIGVKPSTINSRISITRLNALAGQLQPFTAMKASLAQRVATVGRASMLR